MAGSSTLKLIMEKGPREGEKLTYTSRSVIKIGRVVSGNTIAIKDEGISSKHIRIQFDNDLRIWNICDLGSSNGTVLNKETLKPELLYGLHDGDCIKIGESTSFVVNVIGDESPVRRPRRNPRRQRKSVVVENVKSAVDVVNVDVIGESDRKDLSGQWDNLEKMTLGDFFRLSHW